MPTLWCVIHKVSNFLPEEIADSLEELTNEVQAHGGARRIKSEDTLHRYRGLQVRRPDCLY